MYTYVFEADFLYGLSITPQISNAVQKAVKAFNRIRRRAYKYLSVSINSSGGLTFDLVSSIPIAEKNLLLSCQSFSKKLSKDPAVSQYCQGNRLLERRK